MAPIGQSSDDHVTITMGREAAEQLAKACQWGSFRAQDILEDRASYGDSTIARAEAAYEWLSWGSHWLVNEEARTDG